MKPKTVLVVLFSLWLVVLCACANSDQDGKQMNDSLDVKMQAKTDDSQPDEEIPENREDDSASVKTKDKNDNREIEENLSEDSLLDEELSQYRKEREDGIGEFAGMTTMEMPNTDGYSFSAELDEIVSMQQLDTKEMGEAYATASDYVKNELEIMPPTKNTVYMCIDPRIAAIYKDDDKGVAAGYENDNIFICEYCDEDGTWQYLILVRDGKGEPWKVIHNGGSYKE